MADDQPFKFTIAFEAKDRASFDDFWKLIRETYGFCLEGDFAVHAYAVSMGDMFAEQEAIETALDSKLDGYELRELIGQIPHCDDLPALFEEYGISAREAA